MWQGTQQAFELKHLAVGMHDDPAGLQALVLSGNNLKECSVVRVLRTCCVLK